MAIVRWDPSTELSSLQGEMNRLFNSFFSAPENGNGNGNGNGSTRRWVPAMDLYETGSHFVARLDLPGVAEQDIDVEVRDNALVISGERHAEQREEVDGWYRFERASGRFMRQLQLPDGIDADAIAASFADGVLELRIPKPEERKPRKVAIGRGDVVDA